MSFSRTPMTCCLTRNEWLLAGTNCDHVTARVASAPRIGDARRGDPVSDRGRYASISTAISYPPHRGTSRPAPWLWFRRDRREHRGWELHPDHRGPGVPWV